MSVIAQSPATRTEAASGLLSLMPGLFVVLWSTGFIGAKYGLPYAEPRQMGLDEIKGGSPYGASTITGGQGERMPSEQELGMARFQGRHVTTIASKLFG